MNFLRFSLLHDGTLAMRPGNGGPLAEFLDLVVGRPFGYGSKLSHQGTAGCSPSFHLPGPHLGYLFLTHSHYSQQVETCFGQPSREEKIQKLLVASQGEEARMALWAGYGPGISGSSFENNVQKHSRMV